MATLASAIEPPKFGTQGKFPFSLWKGLVKNYVVALDLKDDAKKLILFRLVEGKALEILVNIPGIEKLSFENQLAELEIRVTSKKDDREWRIKFWAAQPEQEQSARLYLDSIQKLALLAFPEQNEREREMY